MGNTASVVHYIVFIVLHINCAMCEREQGVGSFDWENQGRPPVQVALELDQDER